MLPSLCTHPDTNGTRTEVAILMKFRHMRNLTKAPEAIKVGRFSAPAGRSGDWVLAGGSGRLGDLQSASG